MQRQTSPLCNSFSIFALPKPFSGEIERLQRNAIESWRRLAPQPRVVLLGREAGVEEICREYSLELGPDVARNTHGTPLVGDLFAIMQKPAADDVIVYVNADILLPPAFSQVVETVRNWDGPSLAIGQRVKLDVPERLDFEQKDTWRRLQERANREGRPMGPGALDYFVFRPGHFPRVPAFAIGRMYWDNWLVWSASRRGDVIDASRLALAIHQNHDYAHVALDRRSSARHWTSVFDSPESRHNRRLAGSLNHLGSCRDASHFLTGDGVVPNTSLDYVLRRHFFKRAVVRFARRIYFALRDALHVRSLVPRSSA